MDNPTVLVTQVEQLVTTLMKHPDLSQLLVRLFNSPKFRRFRDLVEAIGRPSLISPEPGETLPTSSSITVMFSAGSPTATYTVNIIDSNGTVVHTCTSVTIDPLTLEGTCVIPAGTLADGDNFTVEVVTNGSTFTTIGWFTSAVPL